MTPFSKLDVKSAKRSSSAPEGDPLHVRGQPSHLESIGLLRRNDSPPFADVSLVDTPRIASLSAMTSTSASNTPLPITQSATRSPSPAKRAKPPLVPVPLLTGHIRRGSSLEAPAAGHRRGSSAEAATVGSSDGANGIAAEPGSAYARSGELPERLSWNSEDSVRANGSVSGFAQAKEWAKGSGSIREGSLGGDLPPDEQEEEAVGKGTSNSRRCSCLTSDPLLLFTIIGVLLGIGMGLGLRPANLSPRAIEVLGFPGEIMLRLLKMLVLPLVAGSMVAGVCALRGSTSSMARVARLTLGYYAVTTVLAVVLGIVLVNIIWPGKGQPLGGGSVSSCREEVSVDEAADALLAQPVSPLTALLGVARSIFPDNVAVAAVDMNILGIITFSLFFGIALSKMGDAAEPFIRGIDVFNMVISKMVGWVLWVSPVGVASLIAASICNACDLLQTLAALGLWVATVLIGLAIFAGIILPAMLWAATRSNPIRYLRTFSQALVLAFGTSSSSAALPVAMECAANAGCDDSIIRFVLPLGTTVNMNGTALYEATTVIFIAQAHGVSLGLAGTVVVACTATLAAIGAAAIPSAGLVTMLMVLQAVNLERFAADLAVILAIDWLLDRCRTAVNLMSDSFAVVIVDALCRQRAAPAGQQPYSQLEMA